MEKEVDKNNLILFTTEDIHKRWIKKRCIKVTDKSRAVDKLL